MGSASPTRSSSRSFACCCRRGIETTYRSLGEPAARAPHPPGPARRGSRGSRDPARGHRGGLALGAAVHAAPAGCTRDTALGGVDIPAGSHLNVFVGSANHNERRFPDPDRFDVRRDAAPHVTFGAGPRACLGMHLARLAGHVVLDALLERLDDLRLDSQEPAPQIVGTTFRSPDALPVRFTPSPRGRSRAMELPRLISVDDHVVEPPDLWQRHLPAGSGTRPAGRAGQGQGPWQRAALHVRRSGRRPVGRPLGLRGRHHADHDAVRGGVLRPRRRRATRPCSSTSMLPGCSDPTARLADMDANHVDASLCFPTFPRFCGQTFLEADDKELALACVQAYNDWMIDEWCGGDGARPADPAHPGPAVGSRPGRGRGRALRGEGSHAVCFSEGPAALGLPSVHTDALGSVVAGVRGDRHRREHAHRLVVDVPADEPDAPVWSRSRSRSRARATRSSTGSAAATLERFPTLRIALSRGPGRLDAVRPRAARPRRGSTHGRTAASASACRTRRARYIEGRVFGCIFDDLAGLAHARPGRDGPDHDRDRLPARRLDVAALAARRSRASCAAAGLDDDEIYALVRGNAIRCYGLDRYFGVAAWSRTSACDYVVLLATSPR